MRKRQLAKILNNEEETLAFGQSLAQGLKKGSVLALYGDLGAGKTTLVKGIVSALTGIEVKEVVSPTFTYLQLYEYAPLICHFDLYRMKTAAQFIEMGFLDYLGEEGICLIEWPERIANLLPAHTVRVELVYANEKARGVYVS